MDKKEIKIYLKQLVKGTQSNINGILIIQKNGQLINSFLPDHTDAQKISLIGTILVGSGERACDELNKGNLKQVMVGGDFGKIIFISNGDNEFLGALVPFETNYDDVLIELEIIAALINAFN
ncbi:MAG TPA: hypothetical protein GX531_05645 [Methanothermobacter sp.]|nr:hypothetical protein [Methanothermobacter sp.]